MQGGKSTESSYNVKIELENIQSQAKRSRSKVGFLLKHKYIPEGLQPHLIKGEDCTTTWLINVGSAN